MVVAQRLTCCTYLLYELWPRYVLVGAELLKRWVVLILCPKRGEPVEGGTYYNEWLDTLGYFPHIDRLASPSVLERATRGFANRIPY